jgi:quercetin dioxygenase-like cupin family protein
MDAAQQQVPGINRVDLQQQDLSVPGREMVQNRVELSPEAPPFKHFHYGEEIIYVLEGTLEYEIGVPDGEGRRGPDGPGRGGPLGEERRRRRCS